MYCFICVCVRCTYARYHCVTAAVVTPHCGGGYLLDLESGADSTVHLHVGRTYWEISIVDSNNHYDGASPELWVATQRPFHVHDTMATR